MQDLYSKIKSVIAIAPATYSADTTPTAIDRQGFEALSLSLAIGAGGITFDSTNKIEVKWQDSDDDTTYADVDLADIQGMPAGTTSITTGIIYALTAAHASATVHDFGYIGNKRYHKIRLDFSGTHGTGTPFSAVVMLGAAHVNPTH